MLPEQQLLMVYIVVGSGSKNGFRLPKAALRSHLQSEAICQQAKKTAPGFHKVAWEPVSKMRLEGYQKRQKIGSPASETSSGAASRACLLLAVEFSGWCLASGVYAWRLAGCIWPPPPHHTSSHDNINP